MMKFRKKPHGVFKTVTKITILTSRVIAMLISLVVIGCDETPETVIPDPGPPTVEAVSYYRDSQMKELVTGSIKTWETVYTKITFSEEMQYAVSDYENAQPEMYYRTSEKMVRHKIVPFGASEQDFLSGDTKPIETQAVYFGKYVVQPNDRGAFTLVVGKNSASKNGGQIAEEYVHEESLQIQEIVIDRNLLNFTGLVYIPDPVPDNFSRYSGNPVANVTVTIMAGLRTGENTLTDQDGQYTFQHIGTDKLHLRVEKKGFEPKEVTVHRRRPTVLFGVNPNYGADFQENPGNILIGHAWPREVRFILQETLVVPDLLYVEGGIPPVDVDIGGFYGSGVVVNYSERVGRFLGKVTVLGVVAHEIAHAHQHAVVSVDGRGSTREWENTPEGMAFIEARRKDWEEVGRARYDDLPGYNTHLENAAETCGHYWSVNRWGGKPAYGKLEIEAPNRFRWAGQWLNKK